MQSEEQPAPVVPASDGESESTIQPCEAGHPAEEVQPIEEAQPEQAQPEQAQLEQAQPEQAQPEQTQPEGVQLDGVQPEDVQQEDVQQEGVQQEDVQPDVTLKQEEAQDAVAAPDPDSPLGNGSMKDLEENMEADKPSARKRVPTAAAAAAGEQAELEANARGKPKRKKVLDDGCVSRTTHGGVKIGGRAVTWVGGAGMSREVLDKMGIPQLRAVFLKTFNHPTGSNNAEWLRKKLSQVPDPTVGAARAAVPRARDVTAEIWTTGTAFKGFTKQERFRLQQMGGNCEAKVVEVVGNEGDLAHEMAAASAARSKKKNALKNSELQTMQIIGQEKFEMPPPKRLRGGPHSGDLSSLKALGGFDGTDPMATAPVSMGPVYDPTEGTIQSAASVADPIVATQWRNLEYDERHLLQAGMNVKVYRADENWHHGSLHKVSYLGPEGDLHMCVTIYYWEHDQSETRDIAEFFRGDANSLIQWQAPTTVDGASFSPDGMKKAGREAAKNKRKK